MKKIVSIVMIFLILFSLTFSTPIFAASLDSINVSTNKTKVNPGENVTVNINFGTDLGSYTVDVDYDNNLFEYVSAEGGTSNDNGTRVRVYYFDQTGGSSPRSTMSVTFRAKSDIITTNPTNFGVTAEGLANADASVEYDDIKTPISKDIVIEPNYVDYSINLTYTGDIIINEEKDMKITISSVLGKNYEHTRIFAKVAGPDGATAKILGTDEQGTQHDIVQNGWGAPNGDSIGGKDVSKALNVRGIFDTAGSYTINLALVDLDNSNAEIESSTFNITVKGETVSDGIEGEIEDKVESDEVQNETIKQEPTTLPKTGNTIYFAILSIIGVLAILYVVLKKKD